ncbi:MAG TPA: S8 family serine peptidase [Thermoanaerobaculia bacterium]|jgi:subtilisin family serine protease
MRLRVAALVALLVSTAALAAGPRHVVFTPDAPLTDADVARLARSGVVVQRALADGRFIARVDREAAVSGATSFEPLTLEDKVLRSAWREAARGDSWAALDVMFHDDVDFDEARSAVLAAGGALDDPLATDFGVLRRIRTKIAPSLLTVLAADERVLAVSGPSRFRIKSDNVETATLSKVPQVQAPPYGLTGSGITLSLFELAVGQASHPEFGGRLTVFASGGASGDKSHATHVAGTIGAAGLLPEARGMAPNATLFQFCVPFSGVNTCSGDWVSLKDTELASRNVVADNNSWGFVVGWDKSFSPPVFFDAEEYYGAYTVEDTAPVDDIALRRNVLFVHSAGNEGNPPILSEWGEHRHSDDNFDPILDKLFCYSKDLSGADCPASCNGGCEKEKHHPIEPFDTMTVAGAAKNAIAVGNVDESANIYISSSRGPAKDGRVKPDVVARGVNVLSTVYTSAYGPATGTSMSSPVVTGTAGLIAEQWQRTYGALPRPPQLKALILAGAQDLGNPGPDYTYGFGLLDAKASVDFILNDGANGKGSVIRNLTVAQGDKLEIPLVVSSAQKLRVLLGWGDPSALLLGKQQFGGKALVNDLDLKIIDPSGGEHFAYVLDRDHPSAAATTGTNDTDNTELVEIANAAPGVYRAIISGSRVSKGPQEAVFVTTARTVPACTDVNEPNDTADVAVGDLVSSSTITAAICTAADVDFYRLRVTKPGPIAITVTTGDTPLRVTLSTGSVTDVPANTTATINASAAAVPLVVLVKVEAPSGINFLPRYTLTPVFGQVSGVRRRSVRP